MEYIDDNIEIYIKLGENTYKDVEYQVTLAVMSPDFPK